MCELGVTQDRAVNQRSGQQYSYQGVLNCKATPSLLLLSHLWVGRQRLLATRGSLSSKYFHLFQGTCSCCYLQLLGHLQCNSEKLRATNIRICDDLLSHITFPIPKFTYDPHMQSAVSVAPKILFNGKIRIGISGGVNAISRLSMTTPTLQL